MRSLRLSRARRLASWRIRCSSSVRLARPSRAIFANTSSSRASSCSSGRTETADVLRRSALAAGPDCSRRPRSWLVELHRREDAELGFAESSRNQPGVAEIEVLEDHGKQSAREMALEGNACSLALARNGVARKMQRTTHMGRGTTKKKRTSRLG